MTPFQNISEKATHLITSALHTCQGDHGEAVETLLLAAASLYRRHGDLDDLTDFLRRARLAYVAAAIR
jgi:hypothetical protein